MVWMLLLLLLLLLMMMMQVQELRREGERVRRLQEEMKACTFTPCLNKKTLHVRRRLLLPPLLMLCRLKCYLTMMDRRRP
jgi:hypothetical protein